MKYFITLVLLLCLISCRIKEKKGDKLLIHNNIELKNEFIGNGGFLIIYENGLVGFEESSSFPAFYYIENREYDCVLSRFVNRGQGPNEVLLPFNIQYLNEDTIGVYDIMNMSYYKVPILKDNESIINIKKVVNFNTRFYRVVKTVYNQYLALSGEDCLFSVLDSDGKPVKTLFEYPYKDENEKNISNSIRAIAYQGSIVANPSATKCVYAPFNGDIIYFYDIKKDDISLINKIENVFPSYLIDNGTAITKANTHRGYISITTTENFIYALFSGKTIKELIEKNEAMEGNILRIFDWNGNKIKEIGLDVPCRYIGVSHDDKILWAIARTSDISLVRFNLNEEIEKEDTNNQKLKNNAILNTFQTPNEIINTQYGKTINTSISEVIRIELRNIHKSKTDSVFGVYENLSKITSIDKTSDDITVNIEYKNNYTIIYYLIRKEKLGVFSDTVNIILGNDETMKINLYGNVTI